MRNIKLIGAILMLILNSVDGFASSRQLMLDNEFYLDIKVQEVDKSFTNIEVGPCRWSVSGQQYDNSLLRVRNLVLQDDTTLSEEAGYRVALRCQDATANAFDVQLGFGKGVSQAQILGGRDDFQGIIDDTTVFLAFRYSLGSRQSD